MRIDALTIFPEYLEPLRHALLGKAIEQGILEVGVHDLRDWATGAHKSVDAPPLGGGPGMVMKPEVWGPALDDVCAGRAGTTLTTSAAHRNDKLRHDDVAEVTARPYGGPGDGPTDVNDGEDPSAPLLIVPTPAGTPFTQTHAQAWSREEHIVFACGRYEGIDQRVFEDAALRYRVREVSIGDYVLIGGEVAVLVIAEAVTRLIPGVLGNTESHEEDSFSDGLLEGPSYTKPRVWRGIEAPEVLTSGDHAKVEAWRREQSLKRTRAVRPDLIERVELSDQDRFLLDARDVITTFDVIVDTKRWNGSVEKRMRRALKQAGYVVSGIELGEPRDANVCFEPPMIEQQYELEHGHPPIEPVRTLTVHGRTALELTAATKAVAAALPADVLWYGTTREI